MDSVIELAVTSVTVTALMRLLPLPPVADSAVMAHALPASSARLLC